MKDECGCHKKTVRQRNMHVGIVGQSTTKWNALHIAVVIDVVKSLHGCDRELIFNVVSQLRSMQLPITSIWKQGTYTV